MRELDVPAEISFDQKFFTSLLKLEPIESLRDEPGEPRVVSRVIPRND